MWAERQFLVIEATPDRDDFVRLTGVSIDYVLK